MGRAGLNYIAREGTSSAGCVSLHRNLEHLVQRILWLEMQEFVRGEVLDQPYDSR